MDSTDTSDPLPQVEVGEAGNGNSINGGKGSEVSVRRKRSRPRKNSVETRERLTSLENHVPKRGRGRPPGPGKLQLHAVMGWPGLDPARGNLTPHILNILGGEDICTRILSVVVQMSPQVVSVLSAVGIVAMVDICPDDYLDSEALRYKGHFPIVTLSGSFTLTEAGCRIIGRLSVGLANADSSVFGGRVLGSLIAAEPTQIVLGSFDQSQKTLLQTESAESSMAADGLGKFQVTPSTLQLPEIEEEFIVTPLSPCPEPPTGITNQDVDLPSPQNSDENTPELLSDYASDSTMPDN